MSSIFNKKEAETVLVHLGQLVVVDLQPGGDDLENDRAVLGVLVLVESDDTLLDELLLPLNEGRLVEVNVCDVCDV